MFREIHLNGNPLVDPADPGRTEQMQKAFLVAHGVSAADFDKTYRSFLVEATLGLISIEQNRLMNIFSIAAVVLMPPTLIAGIYGMNFQAMPELKWALGYPRALLLMLMSSVLPLLYLRRRGYL